MNRTIKLILSICILLYFYQNNLLAQKAVVTVPIADLMGQPMMDGRSNCSTKNKYTALAVCGGQAGSFYSCARLHQLIFNDVVEVVKSTNEEVCIRIPHVFYVTPSSSVPQTSYWMLKKNILLLDDIPKDKIPTVHIPEAINFSDTNNTSLNNTNIITLTEPHYDPLIKITFSAGTRFIPVAPVKKKNKKVTVFAINHATMKEHCIKIPAHKCLTLAEDATTKKQINNYVDLLKKWTHTKDGFIPYVLGGTSFTAAIDKPFKQVVKKENGHEYSFYQFEPDNDSPKSGFDCSGVIARATQMCGIPYFYKNTTTIGKYLKPIAQQASLSEGDLILIKGHVMVVSDVQKNLLIEARSYSHGYGKLHEIAINQVFDNINSYADLLDAYSHKKAIQRKDKNGIVRETFNNWQLLSMASVWDNGPSGAPDRI